MALATRPGNLSSVLRIYMAEGEDLLMPVSACRWSDHYISFCWFLTQTSVFYPGSSPVPGSLQVFLEPRKPCLPPHPISSLGFFRPLFLCWPVIALSQSCPSHFLPVTLAFVRLDFNPLPEETTSP